jgi:ATP-binding cassette, subfamily B, bacterial
MQAGKLIKDKINQALYILPALKLVWQSSPKLTAVRAVTLIFQGVLPLVSLFLLKLIIDQIAQSITVSNRSAAFEHALFFLLLLGGVMLLTSAFTTLSDVVSTAQTQRPSLLQQTWSTTRMLSTMTRFNGRSKKLHFGLIRF